MKIKASGSQAGSGFDYYCRWFSAAAVFANWQYNLYTTLTVLTSA